MMNFKIKYKKALETLLISINELKKYDKTDVIYAQLLLCVGSTDYNLMRTLILANITTGTRNKEYKKVLALETILFNLNDLETLVLFENIKRLKGEE